MPKRPVPLSRLKTPNLIVLSDLMPEAEGEDEGPITAKTNVENRDIVVRDWQLGPEKTSVDPKANADFWGKIAVSWQVDEAEARRRFCSNCEYYNNTPEKLAECEAVPLDKFDMDGGGRGFCVKFDFICHSLRVCQAWECKEFKDPD